MEFIGRPKQPSLTVCQLAGPDYKKQIYRQGDAIASHQFPDLKLRLADVMP
ncbi:hypothetical protein RRF56_15860 [Nodosilinea sp. E11]|nr:hypothetical protein [Nodosilinea sp. E11]WOD37685.1 hypothetical protein RRF56_15860 [Nodosilinea sp. E11]